MPKVKFVLNDGVETDVDLEIIQCSHTIKSMVENLGFDDGEEAVPIPLSNLNSEIFAKVVEWATHHKDDPPQDDEDEEIRREKRTDDISTWDAQFLNVEQNTLFDIILAANYLDIKGLLDVGCKRIANMIKGLTADEIRKKFNIKNDLTPEEEEKIRKENDWCEEK